MGRDKALLPVDGRAMALRVADALRAAGAAEVYAVGGDESALAALGLVVQPDDHPGDGPLPATITAVRTATEPVVLVTSCDLVAPDPRAMRSTVRALADRPDAPAAVPLDEDGERQWTHTAWRQTAGATLVAAYEAGARSLRRAAVDLAVVEVRGIPGEALADADVPGDLLPPG